MKNWFKNSNSLTGFILLGFGILLLVLTLDWTGWHGTRQILDFLRGPGWWVILSVYPVVCWIDAWGWRVLFDVEARKRTGVTHLFFVRLAGEAVNNVTPFVDVGGEPLKIHAVKRLSGLSARSILATVVMEKTALYYSELFFWLAGFAASFLIIEPGHELSLPLLAVALTFFAVLTGFLWVQARGSFLSWIGIFDSKLGRFRWFQKLREVFTEVDEIIRSYYRNDSRFVRSVLWHALGWFLGTIEMYAIFKIWGHTLSWTEALYLEAIFHLIKTSSFFIPANLGMQEAGLAMLVQSLGLDPSWGVSLSFVKRIRLWVWTLIGFVFWGGYEWYFLSRHSPNPLPQEKHSG